jgi:RNA polymerase sigma-70 factor (ECF subfamily)
MPRVEAPTLDDGTEWRRGEIRTDALARQLEQHREELTAFCRRIVGSCDAEDAVQETLIRAWRAFDRFEGRAPLRSWLYRIALNVCRDGLRARQRGARRDEMMAQELTRRPVPSLGHRTTEVAIPAIAVDAGLGDPAETAVAREAVALALSALMRLPPRQRAVLILRDVLRWTAVEVAEHLDMTATSVSSALQRARSTLAAPDRRSRDPYPRRHVMRSEVLARYMDAFERHDVALLCSLLREDAAGAPGAVAGGRCRRAIIEHPVRQR